MGDPVDPDKLVSLPQLGKKFGYSQKHLARLAADGKFKAWLVGNSWVTTAELFEQYIRLNPAPGRPKRKRNSKKRS